MILVFKTFHYFGCLIVKFLLGHGRNMLPVSSSFNVVHNILDREGVVGMGEWCKSLKSIETKGNTQLLYRLLNVSICFSETHKICKGQKWSNLNQSKLVQINDCVLMKALFNSLIVKLGEEQKLVGTHTIHFSVKRVLLGKNETWHFDHENETHVTMITLLQNDFNPGLNVALNDSSGLIESVECPLGGAILFDTKKGKASHQNSQVKAARTQRTQTIAQIELQ
jgi:hypothetical protein